MKSLSMTYLTPKTIKRLNSESDAAADDDDDGDEVQM